MPSDYSADELKALWKEAGTNQPMFTPNQLRKETERLLAARRRKFITGLIAASTLFSAFTLFFILFHNPLARIGSALSVLCVGFWIIQSIASKLQGNPVLGETDGVSFYRAELEHLRDCNRGWRFWVWILILPPPWILFNLGFAQMHPELAAFMYLDCAVIVSVFVVLVPMKLRTARKYQQQIDVLNAATRG